MGDAGDEGNVGFARGTMEWEIRGIGGFGWESKCGRVEGWIQGEVVGEGLGFSMSKIGGLDG